MAEIFYILHFSSCFLSNISASTYFSEVRFFQPTGFHLEICQKTKRSSVIEKMDIMKQKCGCGLGLGFCEDSLEVGGSYPLQLWKT